MNPAKAAAAAILIAGLAACSPAVRPAATNPAAGSQSVAQVQTVTAGSPPSGSTVNRQAVTLAAIPPAMSDNVDNTDPIAVARAVVTTSNHFDTRTDTSSLDALRRAARWLTPALLAGSLAVPPRPDAGWAVLAAHRGYTTVDHIALANEYGQPPNTADTYYIQISYVVNDLGRDGWSGTDAGPQLARLQLVKQGDCWRVKAFA